ncbi:hypothetical protein B566_EDAN012978 [Ephemera danica]|nr:hypothetical protein B566_EDAN012978 [Ephemera danica]
MNVLHITMERRRASSIWLAAILGLILAEDYAWASSQAEIERHLELGRDMLARGQFQDALSHYHAAVEGDPKNYLTYFKRATVYLALGKARFAISDLERVLELKPDFTAARLQIAQAHVKQGNLDSAEEAYTAVYHVAPGSIEVAEGLQRILSLRHDVVVAQSLVANGDYEHAAHVLTACIEAMPWDTSLRDLRAKARLALGDPRGAIADIRSATRLSSDNTDGFLQLARLHYDLGEAAESLREVRECLRLDADHKQCFAHYKLVKKVAKAIEEASAAVESQNYATCVSEANKVLKFEDKVPLIRFEAYDRLCRCQRHTGQLSESLASCTAALSIQRHSHLLCDRAETYIDSEMYDDAIHDYQAALELDESSHRARDGLERAKKLLKQSERDEKKMAEKKFIDIAAAKEVLTDPEKRQKFDQGEDPLDPENQKNQGFNPFHHFHNSPFQFKFHFN